jgi:hypothetical protein
VLIVTLTATAEPVEPIPEVAVAVQVIMDLGVQAVQAVLFYAIQPIITSM